jgi:hypothetical protein
MASSDYIETLRRMMLAGVQDARHQQLVLNAMGFADGIINKLGPSDYGLVRERGVDKRRIARAISRFIDRDVHWTTVVSVPPGPKGQTFWWADIDTYRGTLKTACQVDKVFPYTEFAMTFDMAGKCNRITKHLSDLGYCTNRSVSGATNGLEWGNSGASPGYIIWFDTIFPVLKALCLAATSNQPLEADRIVELATVMREVLPLGEKKSQEYSWVVLAAPDP